MYRIRILKWNNDLSVTVEVRPFGLRSSQEDAGLSDRQQQHFINLITQVETSCPHRRHVSAPCLFF